MTAIAGATMGIGVSIPQTDGVIRTGFPPRWRVGGDSDLEVQIETPLMYRLIIGIDDTDDPSGGATWALASEMIDELGLKNVMDLNINQMDPSIPYRTTNCVSIGLSLAEVPDRIPDLIQSISIYHIFVRAKNNKQ
jgi:hypothetical protein